MAKSNGVPIAPLKGKKKHLQDNDLFACTFTDGKTYKVAWKDVKVLFVDPPSKWHVKDLTGGNLPVKNVDAVFDMAGNELSGKASVFTINQGQECIVVGNEVSFNNRGQETHCNWNFGDQTDTRFQTQWESMFAHNWGFNGDISHLDVTEAAFDLTYIFDGCYAFNQPVSHFNTKNVNTVRCAFQVYGATEANSAFNQDVSWDLKNCQHIGAVFRYQQNFDGRCANWDFSNAYAIGVFSNCGKFSGKGLETWSGQFPKATGGMDMFYRCKTFTGDGIDFSNWNFPIATNFKSMFGECFAFRNNTVSGFRTPEATNMIEMFYFAESLLVDLRGWCVPKITSAPSKFNYAAGGVIPPVWGTCP